MNNSTTYNLWNKYDFVPSYDANKTSVWIYPDTFENMILKSTSTEVTYGEHDISYVYNSYGFRVSNNGPTEFEDASKYPTLLVSGCSITEGIGLPEEHIWHSFLVDELTKVSKLPIAKINLGKGGKGADHAIRTTYVSIEHKGARPDLVYMMLPPPQRKEMIFTNETNQSFFVDILPGYISPNLNLKQQLFISTLERNIDIRQLYHDYYKNLLFIKYYLKSKNIPWFFSCWADSLECPGPNGVDGIEDVDIPSELLEHFIPGRIKLPEDIHWKYKQFKQTIARDYAHFGPNSHFEMASTIYDKLLQREYFLKVTNKWKNYDR